MTIEAVLLLVVTASILLGAFTGQSGPVAVFKKAGPRLGARLEYNIRVGTGFKEGGKINEWHKPPDDPHLGDFHH